MRGRKVMNEGRKVNENQAVTNNFMDSWIRESNVYININHLINLKY